MELLLLSFIPILFLALGLGMMVVSQVSGFFSFRRYSQRQQESSRLISGFLAKMSVAQSQISARSRELAKLSNRLAASNQDLERLNSMKSKFLSMAVHDVRTPLATIKGYAELLAERGLPKKEANYLDGIIVSSNKIGRLMGDLTDLAVIEAGKFRMEKAPFEIGPLLDETLAIFAPLAAQRQVALSSAPVPPGLAVTGDRFRLGQVLSNFLGNAIKFTPSGGRVEVRAAAAGQGTLFSVSDNGPGIHPSERRRIFEKFYQSVFANPAMSKTGWGLGLTIAQEVVRAHGGAIGVESAGLGKGSKFWFFVPAKPPAKDRVVRAPRRFIGAACALAALAASLAPASAQNIPLDDKAKYDKFLEEKAETVLLKMLGPNRAKVVVDATLDFTRTERMDVSGGVDKAQGEQKTSLFAWQQFVAGPSAQQELLPGIPFEGRTNTAPAQPVSYERKFVYPTSFVKRLAVTILLDRNVTVEQADSVQSIVSDLLEIDPNRGDALTVVRTTFAPAWKTIWHQQDSFSMVFRYSVVSLMTILILIVVAACFMKLAGAMDSMARVQSQQYAMDIGLKGDGSAGAAGGLPALEGPPGSGTPAEKGERAADEDGLVKIRVLPEQVSVLVEMLKSEDPDNVALVAAHLEPPILKEFLAGLPRALEAGILMRLGKVRFVDEEIIDKIKSEIERRLATAIGGLDRVFEIVDTKPPHLQLELLRELEGKDPELYRRVRARVLLFEDLMKLSDRDFPILMANTKVDDWACALQGGPDFYRDAVRAQVMPKTWVIIEQVMQKAVGTPVRVAAAESSLLDAARQLIADGKIQNPLEAAAAPPAPAAMAARPQGAP
ncbi:MAG: hypothetical protein HY078_06930 [Elusimicrobia bacterium]|nr:hypothetical protein [Elusimicrobiota bacterium]